MTVLEVLGFLTFPVGFVLLPAIYLRRFGMSKGRSPGYWFWVDLARIFFPEVYARLAPSNIFPCPHCREPILLGQSSCMNCGRNLPDAYSLTTLVDSSEDYDGACSECATPYSRADYRDDALEMRCSRCNVVL